MINFDLEVLRESDRIESVQGEIQGTGTGPVLEFGTTEYGVLYHSLAGWEVNNALTHKVISLSVLNLCDGGRCYGSLIALATAQPTCRSASFRR